MCLGGFRALVELGRQDATARVRLRASAFMAARGGVRYRRAGECVTGACGGYGGGEGEAARQVLLS